MSIICNRFVASEKGLELSEYAIAAALITLSTVLAISSLSLSIQDAINNLANQINTISEQGQGNGQGNGQNNGNNGNGQGNGSGQGNGNGNGKGQGDTNGNAGK
jgi:Flp pilus assembly pilin Flp